MTPDTEQLTADLRDELAANSRSQPVDPRSAPCRFSTLKQFALSPLHYWHACQDQFEETLSMRLGSGAHAILFDQPVVTFTGATRRGKAWDEFRAANANACILNQNERRQAELIADAIRRNELACRVLFEGTRIEQRIDWSWDGRAFRSTPDAYGTYHLVDLKCLRSAEPDRVMWQSRAMHYHAQAALYRRAILEAHNRKVRDCYLVVVENKPPCPVSVLRFTERALEMGDRLCVAWNERRRVHEDSNTWPGYVQSIVDLDLPGDSDVDELGLVFDDETQAAG